MSSIVPSVALLAVHMMMMIAYLVRLRLKQVRFRESVQRDMERIRADAQEQLEELQRELDALRLSVGDKMTLYQFELDDISARMAAAADVLGFDLELVDGACRKGKPVKQLASCRAQRAVSRPRLRHRSTGPPGDRHGSRQS